MASKSKKYCSSFSCNQVAVNGVYCQKHQPARTPKETLPFYLSVRWRAFREWYIGKHPLCEQCMAEDEEQYQIALKSLRSNKVGVNASGNA